MSSSFASSSMRALLEECGYTGSRLHSRYTFGNVTIPLVGFATSERDMDSACIAVMDGGNDPEAAVRSCYELAAPVVWVPHNGSVDWWIQKPHAPQRFHTDSAKGFPAFVRKYKQKLDPVTIYRSRTIARIDPSQQLEFVDAGLLPLRREEAGKKLHDIVERMIDGTLKAMGRSTPGKEALRDVFTSVFRLLAGKILKDKRVGAFATIDLTKPKVVLNAVASHYNTKNAAPSAPASGYAVLAEAAHLLADAGSFAVVSPESLAYVYEHTLVTKELRKKLGIHATPPWLVDYMVWQLYDWVREIPIEDRHVFEPACGHAPFLLSMMRLLRMEMHGRTDTAVHAYLKDHIHGVEIDDFAREIARLSLTLADIPNPNGWDLQSGDMYASKVLREEATRCRILLCNPPYEKFDRSKLRGYESAHRPTHHGKSAEMLYRTLPNLAPSAIFSLVLPQAVLHSAETREVRRILLRDFDIREIFLFADKVFEEGEPESVVLIGRRRTPGEARESTVRYRRVREDGVTRFSENYTADSETKVPVSEFQLTTDLRAPDLFEVWTALRGNQRVASVADVGQGFSFANRGLIDEARRLGNRKTSDSVRAFIDGHTSTNIWDVPDSIWLSPSRTPVMPWRSGNATGSEQVLVNYVRAMRGPWRIKAFLDRNGLAAINTYNTVRPKSDEVPALFLWAILNSPIGNGYVYAHTMQKHNYDTLVAKVPLPGNWKSAIGPVTSAAREYFRLVERALSDASPPKNDAVVETLLAVDAAVLEAYDLSARLERRLLDLFNVSPESGDRRRRKGVGCIFPNYYPSEFKSFISLYKFISPAYRGSTASNVSTRMKPGDSRSVTKALREAARAFGEED